MLVTLNFATSNAQFRRRLRRHQVAPPCDVHRHPSFGACTTATMPTVVMAGKLSRLGTIKKNSTGGAARSEFLNFLVLIKAHCAWSVVCLRSRECVPPLMN